MTKLSSLVAGGLFAIASALPAAAETFDFAYAADTLFDEGNWSDVVPGETWTVGSRTVEAYATNSQQTFADAYLDGKLSNTRLGGLGVCSTPEVTDCGSDDNAGLSPLGALETLYLEFNRDVRLTDLTLRDIDHYLFNDGDQIVVRNETLGLSDYFIVGTSNLADWGVGTLFSFEMSGRDEKPFYISSLTVTPVPLPAGGLLLATALGGLAVARRRRKAA